MTSIADTPLPIDLSTLHRLASICEPHSHAIMAGIRAEFGEDDAATLYVLELAMLLGVALRTIPNADRAPAGVAHVWSLLGVPFSLEQRQHRGH